MIEERLRETLDQVAAGGPAEAGAYDRFLHQRARRARRVAATTALGLAVLLALVVMLPGQPRGGDDGDDKEQVPTLGPAQPERWRPGPPVVAAPLQGFEALVPHLRPRPEGPSQAAELFQDNNGFGGDISGRIGPGEARTTGRFPGGRPAEPAGDDRTVLEGELPEGMALAPGFLGVEWRWTNWCGGDVRVRFRGGLVGGTGPPSGDLRAPSARPACVDPSRPTRLKLVEWGE